VKRRKDLLKNLEKTSLSKIKKVSSSHCKKIGLVEGWWFDGEGHHTVNSFFRKTLSPISKKKEAKKELTGKRIGP